MSRSYVVPVSFYESHTVSLQRGNAERIETIQNAEPARDVQAILLQISMSNVFILEYILKRRIILCMYTFMYIFNPDLLIGYIAFIPKVKRNA